MLLLFKELTHEPLVKVEVLVIYQLPLSEVR